MRLICWAPRLSWPALIEALYRAWLQGKDVSATDGAARDRGPGRFRSDTAERGMVLPRQPLTCVAAPTTRFPGVFGVPSFIVQSQSGPRLFFGQDRLHFVEEALRHHPLSAEGLAEAPPSPGGKARLFLARRRRCALIPVVTARVANEARSR